MGNNRLPDKKVTIRVSREEEKQLEQLMEYFNEMPIKERKPTMIYCHPVIYDGVISLAAENGMKKNNYITKIFLELLREEKPEYFEEKILVRIKKNAD